MSHYFDPESALKKIGGNVTFNNDGTVWAHFVLNGYNFSPSSGDSYVLAQQAHERLFTKLSALDVVNYKIHGFKSHITLAETLRRIQAGMPEDFTAQKYPIVARNIAALKARKQNNELKEFCRIYWLSVQIPAGGVMTGSALRKKFVKSDPLEGYAPEDFVDEVDDILAAIPPEFGARKATAEQMFWTYDRKRYMGLRTIPFPESVDNDTVRHTPNPESFPSIGVNKLGSITPDVDTLLSDIIDDDEETLARAKQTYSANYNMAKYSTVMAVSNPAKPSDEIPDGLTSFQSHMLISRFPAVPKLNMMAFTALADQEIGVDADWTLVFNYDQTLLDKESIRKFRGEYSYLAESLSKDDLDAADFEDDAIQAQMFHATRERPTGQIPMKVAAVFSFAHNDRDMLAEAVNKIIAVMERNGYAAEVVPGSNYNLFKHVAPGVSVGKLLEKYKQATTVQDFAPCFPLRDTVSGDPVGFPLMTNRENSFGQLVYYDAIHAPDSGNASILALGSQGSGKSHFMKYFAGWVAGMHAAVHLYDPSPTGEYETYVRSLAGYDPMVTVDVVNFGNPNYSLDPLKMYPDDYDRAKSQFIKVYLPMLKIDMDSPVLGNLTVFLEENFRKAYKVNSVRDLVTRIRRQYKRDADDPIGAAMSKMANALDFISSYPAGRALVDPEGMDLPPLTSDTSVLVFRTAALKPAKKDKEVTVENAVGSAIYLAAAEFTSDVFMKRMKDMPCFTIGDEMGFLSNNPETLEVLVRDSTLQGRKYRKALLAGIQDEEHLTDDYNQISKVIALRQEKEKNALRALDYAGLPTNDVMVDRMIHHTSPRNDNGYGVKPGRYGEGWFVDGIHFPIRMQTLPEMTSTAGDASNTMASTMAARA